MQKEVHRFKLERDIYEKTAEIIKKAKNINMQYLTNREKVLSISALRDTVNIILDCAISTLKKMNNHLFTMNVDVVATRSCWIERMDEAWLKRSMSKKRCAPDNSACECFFGR